MNLKPILMAVALAGASASAMAATYAVWPAAAAGEEQIPVEFSHWWNFTSEITEIDGQQVNKCRATDGSAAASSGWMTPATANYDFTQLAELDLTFDAMIEGSGIWKVRLTTPDTDQTLDIPRDGKFHTVRFNIKADFPAIYNTWQSGAANAADIFPFSLVGDGLSSDAAIYFTNCRYVDAIGSPSITAAATDITYNSATLSFTATFPEGYTNTSVTVNGEAVEGSSLALTDLKPNTEYSYTIVASGEYEGSTYSKSTTVTFKTARIPGNNPVWYGITDKEGFSAEYSITYNDDKTLTVEAYIETEKETPEADRNFHIYIGGDEWLKLYDNGSSMLEGTTTSTFEDGATITWEWYLPYAGGVYQETNTYVIGSENEKPLSLRIKASSRNVTATSAEIAYEVTAADDNYEVYYLTAGGAAVKATANPIVLTGLTERTEYTYELYATNGSLESSHITVSFKTPAADAVDYVYADILSAELKNAFLIGEDASMSRSIMANIPWSVTYKTDGTAVYEADLASISNVVGLVPKIYWNGFQNLTKNAETGFYEYNFGAQELEAATAISHYFEYAGGVVDVRTAYTAWGMEKEMPEIGAPEQLHFSASKYSVILGEPVTLDAYCTDANGCYIATEGVTYTVSGGNYTLEGNTVVFPTGKGTRTIKAEYEGLSAELEIHALASAEAKNLAAGRTGYTDEAYIQAGSIENVTDTNRESQLEWNCAETHEHYFVLDLCEGDEAAEGYYIEAVEVLFEGAYAKRFTITLSNTAPTELNPVTTSRAAAPGDDVVLSNEAETTQHYFERHPATSHRYVTLRTQEALNSEWGIKLRDLKVYGTADVPTGIPTGVEGVAADNTDAPVEFYNLNGVRVANPATGIYIRRQGNTVTKVFIK